MGCALVILFQARSTVSGPLNIPRIDRSPLMGPFLGVPQSLDYTQNLARSILALKLSVTTTFFNSDSYGRNLCLDVGVSGGQPPEGIL